MVSKPDLRVTNGYIIGVSQRSVCSGVVRSQIRSHLSLWLLKAQRSVAQFNGHATGVLSEPERNCHTFTQVPSIILKSHHSLKLLKIMLKTIKTYKVRLSTHRFTLLQSTKRRKIVCFWLVIKILKSQHLKTKRYNMI